MNEKMDEKMNVESRVPTLIAKAESCGTEKRVARFVFKGLRDVAKHYHMNEMVAEAHESGLSNLFA